MFCYKHFLLGIILTVSLTTVFAQYENTSGQKPEKKKEKVATVDRWFGGGMIGGGFSSGGGGYFEISPLIGYKLTPDFHVGTRITYIYSSYRGYSGSYNQSHTYGGSLLGRYVFLNFLFAQAEFEVLSFKHFYTSNPDGVRSTLTNLYLGGGYYQSFGQGFATIGIFYNVLEDPNLYYPYSNPLIRIGFGFGF